jgi:hypothetical protein
MSGPSTWDRAKDIGWNALTAIPGVGTVAGTAALAADGINTGLDAAIHPSNLHNDYRNLAQDAISLVPLVGTINSVMGIDYDLGHPDDTWSNRQNVLMGGEDKYHPAPPPDQHQKPSNWVPSDQMNDVD